MPRSRLRTVHCTLSALPALLLATALAAPAAAQEQRQPVAFKPILERIVADVVEPSYDRLVEAAEAERDAVAALCEAPGDDALAAARDGFADLVLAFSAVEPYRFGPAREDNRFEKLFFWPDRRGIGLRQVQGLLAEEDPSATAVDTLRDKSVAVQGLLALDYVLSDDDADVLAETPAGYRCAYAEAIAGAILTTATEIRDGWIGPDGYGALMMAAGPDNPVFRSHGEAVQEFLEAGREQLQVVGAMKIAAIIGETPKKARPKLAPFWRSGLVLASLQANLEAVEALQEGGGIAEALPEDEAFNADSLSFQLGEAAGVFAALEADGRDWIELAKDPGAHDRLSYSAIPVAGALTILADRYPAALGLTLGFNSLDGD
ncbi:imelysin family protein [Amorphus coralli]|uniref:imelysin family protein n=1 Tax=Amorphus coralli TaxID=340680 RepID=UPI000379E891|nr:imelysin family protein [Amorphus coralli]